MQTVAAFVALLAIVQLAIAQGAFTINTPSGVTSCQPTRFSWVGGQAPYILQLTEGSTPGGAVIKEFDDLNGDGFTWIVDVPGGTNFIANLKDSTGVIAQTAFVTVGNGNTSCVNTSVTESASGQTSGPVSTGPPTPPATPTATSAPGSPSSGGPSATSPTGSGGGSTSGKPPSTGSATTGGAAQQSSAGAAQPLAAGTIGFTGLMGLLGAMLF